MCYHTEHKATAKQLKDQYKAKFPKEKEYKTSDHVNGFEHRLCPIITSTKPDEIQLFSWGLIPHWAKDLKIQNSTLNARFETLVEKPSFREYITQRCIIPVTGLIEWEGKAKDKTLIQVENKPIFSLAGLWNSCPNPITGEIIESFTAVTNSGFVAILDNEKAWLNDGQLLINEKLITTFIGKPKKPKDPQQLGLFFE